MDRSLPWQDPLALADVVASWREAYAGRELFRVSAGPGWVRLHLAGDDRVSLLLCDVPGARLVLRHRGRLPEPLAQALTVARRHPLHGLLRGARLVRCGVLPHDRVVALHWQRPQGGDVTLLHRLFGARGNTTLLDPKHTLLWSRARPPHPALSIWPADAAFSNGVAGRADAAYDARALTHLVSACAELAVTVDRAALLRALKANSRLLANLDRDLANADQGKRHRRKAEALAANLHDLKQGAAEVVLADLSDGQPLRIALDPAQTPAANMEAWFRRARKADNGLAIIRTRRQEAAQNLARLEAAGRALMAANDRTCQPIPRLAGLQAWHLAHAALLPASRRQATRRVAEEPARPFRRYVIDGVWDVWVGRSGRENDDLTHRAAHQRDIWLHAQGVSGSHVILRTAGHPENVPRSVLAKAAALAALNSKARNSGLVPVIHTEKRYVRKPRKSPPGTAACLRDESLFVEPVMPAGVEPA